MARIGVPFTALSVLNDSVRVQKNVHVATKHDLNVSQPALAVYISKRSNTVNDEAILNYWSLESLLATPCKGVHLSVEWQIVCQPKIRTCHAIV